MKKPDDFTQYNRQAWNDLVRKQNRWTVPATDEMIRSARAGTLDLVLTPSKKVPANWYPAKGSKVLALASGGGQQVPLMAAYGFDVTVFDNSDLQLERDLEMANKHQLTIVCHQGDMSDLSELADESFDMVFNPCSTCFVPDVVKVYKEVSRVLRKGGIFMTGFTNPVYYLFDIRLAEKGIFTLKYESPYSDAESLDHDELNHFLSENEPLVFGHSLEAHINGQLDAGLSLTALYEDHWGDNNPVDKYFKAFVATRAVKI